MAVLYLQLSFAIFTLTTVVRGYRSKNEQYFTVGREIGDAKSYDFIRDERFRYGYYDEYEGLIAEAKRSRYVDEAEALIAADEDEIEELSCLENPCRYGGTCVVTSCGSYECKCRPGFSGKHCDCVVKECDFDKNPCRHNATCIDMGSDYICKCPSGIKGRHCEIDIDECDALACSNEATCINTVGSYMCKCRPGFKGKTCCSDINECESSDGDPCENGGTCENTYGSFWCACPSGFVGKRCERDRNECVNWPCENGGKCINTRGSYECSCPETYQGEHCERDVDECLTNNPCKNGATCTNLPGDYKCDCPKGWEGKNCDQDVNECTSTPCKNGGTCVNLHGSFECLCTYQHSGVLCEQACNAALGMESGAILDEQIIASSEYDGNHAAKQGRLNFLAVPGKAGSWSARTNDANQWIQVKLPSNTKISRFSTQGRNAFNQWVTKYQLMYSEDGLNFHYYHERGQSSPKEFQGNSDSETIVYHELNPPIEARYVRLRPTAWHNHISLRMELYGCEVCVQALGMESRDIVDAQITASSEFDGNHAAKQGRLNFQAVPGKAGSWSARTNDVNQWIQIKLPGYTKITRFATQGRNAFNQWVTQYKLEYSEDGVTFHYYHEPGQSAPKIFHGNTDSNTIVTHELLPPIQALYIRLRPTAWFNHISMRMEIYGCPACTKPLGMESGAILDAQITASSEFNGNHAATQGRLNFLAVPGKAGSWSARTNDVNQWIQIKFPGYTKITQFATQGRNAFNQWVTQYKLEYSEDGVTFHYYHEPGQSAPKEFVGNTDSNTIVTHELFPPIQAHYIRLRPSTWVNHISLRMEVYGCRACVQALGMENGDIKDAQITASSEFDGNHAAKQGRLNFLAVPGKAGSWSARTNDVNQWIQVKLPGYTKITRFATQGRNAFNQWVKQYKLEYSEDGVSFHYYHEPGQSAAKIFHGNTDSNTIVTHELLPPIQALYIRLRPTAWFNHISMRMEIYGCPACAEPLGMESGAISDAQITASSEFNGNHAAKQGRLNFLAVPGKAGSWSARTNDVNQWIQVKLPGYTRITRFATQGRNAFNQWVTQYKLEYSEDGVTFLYYHEPGQSAAKIFHGNTDSNTIVTHELLPPIQALYIRLRPTAWFNHVSMRIEIYGCPACTKPLGMESGAILDAQITASSEFNGNHAATQGRLNFLAVPGKAGSWSARTNDVNQWIQVKLPGYTKITQFATQGRNAFNQWVTKYKLEYSEDGVTFHYYHEPGQSAAKIFHGNTDSNTIVTHELLPPIQALYIRLRPTAWFNHISMRMEIYGCPACAKPLGMESGAILDAQITASSEFDGNHAATQGRLNFLAVPGKAGSWSARTNDVNQWIQVKLPVYTRITRFATQGRNAFNQWVTKYKLEYSEDGVTFDYYHEPGQSAAKIFHGNTDSNTIVTHELLPPIQALYIRLRPTAWFNHISMRMEIYGCPACTKPLGMESGAILDAHITASSEFNGNHAATQGRLNFLAVPGKAGSWSARTNDVNQWIQVKLPGYTKITQFATQGRNAFNQWVTKYKIEYSEDGVTFHYYHEPGQSVAKIFHGNTDSNTIVTHELLPPIQSLYIRVRPTAWFNHVSMRMEIYGCPACIKPLGMESGAILDAQITASSEFNGNHAAKQGRLNFLAVPGKAGSWSARTNDVNQWIRVKLPGYTRITRFATQGRNAFNQWVKQYKLEYSEDGVTFHYYHEPGQSAAKIFHGNTDSNTIVTHELLPPIQALYIRLRPTAWFNHISMRMEIYGCPTCAKSLGMENGAILDAQITASSEFDGNHAATQGRLNFLAVPGKAGSWSSRTNDVNQWIQVKLPRYTKITRFATQGRNAFNQWVTQYKLEYSEDGVTFHYYHEPGQSVAKIFHGNTDSNTIVTHELLPPIQALYIRLRPTAWFNHISMRMEIYGCPACAKPLGMESGAILDAQITASSEFNGNHAAKQGRLNFLAVPGKAGSWSARTNDVNQWIQVKLPGYTKITQFATQGRNAFNQWVTKYKLEYSEDGVTFHYYHEPGQSAAKIFHGNTDSNTIVTHELLPPIQALYIRLRPTAWFNHISMRMEIYGCPACAKPLGMESGAILDAQITASSEFDGNHAATQGRLNFLAVPGKAGSWSARTNDASQWIQVKLPGYTKITQFATQGRNAFNQWVTKYKLEYSEDGVTFHYYHEAGQSAAKIFRGNTDSNTIVTHELLPPIQALYIRLRPTAFFNHISMRMEIYGCPACAKPLGMESGAILDAQITASSEFNGNHAAKQGRLNFLAVPGKAGSWSARTNDVNQWIQVKLPGYTKITQFATQGRNAFNQWVTKYKLEYSEDGVTFHYYHEPGQSVAKIFHGNTDSNTIVTHELLPPIQVLYIRLRPAAWFNHISMRMELYGCEA
ncbi:uncharacterized protein [Pocillopora verrucosa]|uniref:uncharacterized protein isoform X1 n=1 Tax=Pocillopora verrucosa TaxID=203993 RepID=UPI0033402FE2